MSNAYHPFHVIKDPVHGAMQFSSQEDAWIKPFISHPHFQRMRHIKQLGMADLVFPGAVHTRFNHGLGCCYVAGQMASKLGLAPEDRQLVMVAALLHDIGHGPFSHAFEGLFKRQPIRHEQWTPSFLDAFSNDAFFRAYNSNNADFPMSPEKFVRIKKMIMHQDDNKLLSDIVSSQLDADRMDYLLRDSHFCGVRYGEFDLRWMLHCLTVIDTDEGLRLGVTHKGVGVVEHYLAARRLMMRNIYHHYKKLAIENLLVRLLMQLSESFPHASFLQPLANTPLARFLIQVYRFNHGVEQTAAAFIAENSGLYHSLLDYHVTALIAELAGLSEQHTVVELAKRIHHRRLPKIFPLHHLDNCDEIIEQVTAFKAAQSHCFHDWQIQIIKTPQLAYTGQDDPIYVLEKTGKRVPISDFSLMINALTDRYEHACSLFLDEAILAHKGIQRLLDHTLKACQHDKV